MLVLQTSSNIVWEAIFRLDQAVYLTYNMVAYMAYIVIM